MTGSSRQVSCNFCPQTIRGIQPLAQAARELHFKDMQDFDFTMQCGVSHTRQSRDGKHTPLATVRSP